MDVQLVEPLAELAQRLVQLAGPIEETRRLGQGPPGILLQTLFVGEIDRQLLLRMGRCRRRSRGGRPYRGNGYD